MTKLPTKYKFPNREEQAAFFRTLKARIADYFETHNTSRYGDWRMVVKTIVMLLLFFGPYTLMMTGVVSSLWGMYLIWLTMGLGMAGIGMGVMHDANHGSYARKKWINRYLGKTANLVGAQASMWKVQHNVLHHTYTNVEGTDEDIRPPAKLLRFSPHAKHYKIHRFQHLYAWIFYGISTLAWVISKDFINLFRYRQKGLIKGKERFRKEFVSLVGWKALYFFYILVLPIWLLPVSPGFIILGFVSMHFVTGITLSLVFQTAHVVPQAQFPLPDEEGKMSNSWAIHQLLTTANFKTRRWFSWFIGGLDYQVEHHLFSNISHIHYRDISKIVAKTAREFNLPYHRLPSFRAAVLAHFRLLKALGRQEQPELTN